MRASLLLLFLTGCASSPKIVEDIPTRRTTVLAVPEVRSIFSEPTPPVEEMIRVPEADAIHAIKRALVQLEIPITVEDAKLHAIGNNDFNKIHRLGNRPMIEFVDCGATANGPRASTYRIYMSFITTVEATTNRATRVSSMLVAHARDAAGGNTAARVPCGSTGKLERMLMDSVRTMVGGQE